MAYLASVDVGCHLLTIVDPASVKSSKNVGKVYEYGTAFSAESGGGVVCDGFKFYLSHDGESYSAFTGPGTFVCRNNGYPTLFKSSAAIDWSLQAVDLRDDQSQQQLYYVPNDLSRSGEPVFFEQFLDGGLNLSTNFCLGWRSAAPRTVPYACVSFRGRVSGPGSIRPDKFSSGNYDGYGISLTDDENDFTGGILGLQNSWLALGGIRAAGKGKVQLRDSTLQFFCTDRSNGVYRLPETELSGTMLVRADGAGNGFHAGQLTLMEGATVAANATVVQADTLSLGSGAVLSLRNPAKDHASFRRAFAGLYVGGMADPANPNNIRICTVTTEPFTRCVTNCVRWSAPFRFKTGI